MYLLIRGNTFRPLLAMLSTILLVGCAGYQTKMDGTIGSLQSGSVDNAIANLDSKNTSKDKDLLFHLEKGELLRMKGSYEASRDQWLIADERVRGWEDQVKTDPSKLLGNIGSVLVNDTTRVYDGRDFEKVFLNVRLAMDHVALGNWDHARTEIKKMHERESIIADFRSKEIDAAKKAAGDKGLRVTSFKELDGYPVETLQDPAVRNLKNAYESAFANYLAGFVYEALGEPSLAAAGYRKAAEMRPDVPMIDASLADMDARSKKRSTRMVDTLFVIESGTAPAIESKMLPIILPIPGKNGISWIATPISWPVIRPSDTSIIPSSINLDERTVPVTLLTNVDVMARRALADEMPGIIVRSSIRAIVKGVAQKAIDDNASRMGMAGLFVSIAAKAATFASEVADERAWRTLPGFFSIGRTQLAEGTHKVSLQTPGGLQTREIQVSGSHAVISLRTSGSSLYLAQSPYIPTMGAVVTQEFASPLPLSVDVEQKVTPKSSSKLKKRIKKKAKPVPAS